MLAPGRTQHAVPAPTMLEDSLIIIKHLEPWPGGMEGDMWKLSQKPNRCGSEQTE